MTAPGARLRVAWYSPLPPQRSGIADYSAELLPHVRALADVETIEGDAEPAQADVALYHLGNNRDFHAGIWRALLARPGVLVLHEPVIHHLVRDLTLHAGDPAGYVDALRWCYGRSGEALGRRAVSAGVPLDPFRYPLFERAVDASRGVIVHDEATAARVRRSRPLARVHVIPSHVALAAAVAVTPAEARARLGLAADTILVSTFGFVTEAKRMPVLLRAFARVRAAVPADVRARLRLLVVGEISPHYDLARVFAPELRAGVELVGRLPLPEFLLQMAACDVAVNLRYPTAGETSATLMRLLGLGKPVVVSNLGTFAAMPDGCCAKIDLDGDEEEVLVTTLQALVLDPALRAALGRNARRYVATHTPEASARAYVEVLRRCVEERWQAPACPPPLAASPPGDLLAELVRDVGAELADAGAGEEDPVLAEIARAIVELDLDLAAGGHPIAATGAPRAGGR